MHGFAGAWLERATSHWIVREVLAEFGAAPVDERVVTYGRIITGAGVSAGLDLALSVVQQLRGRLYAEALMLQAEYAPEPPLPGERVSRTHPAIASALEGIFAPFVAKADQIALARQG